MNWTWLTSVVIFSVASTTWAILEFLPMAMQCTSRNFKMAFKRPWSYDFFECPYKNSNLSTGQTMGESRPRVIHRTSEFNCIMNRRWMFMIVHEWSMNHNIYKKTDKHNGRNQCRNYTWGSFKTNLSHVLLSRNTYQTIFLAIKDTPVISLKLNNLPYLIIIICLFKF